MEMRVDGLVIAGDLNADDELTRATLHTPAVVAGTRAFDLPAADLVANDDAAGARMAVEHLIGLGHIDIAFLTAPTGSASLRANAYRDTMTRHGLQDYIRVVPTDMSEHSGFAAMNSLIDSGRTPTAVFAANDILAIGALSAAGEHGISVPSQLSLVGYDNTYLAGIMHLPSLQSSPSAGKSASAPRSFSSPASPTTPCRHVPTCWPRASSFATAPLPPPTPTPLATRGGRPGGRCPLSWCSGPG